MLISTSQKEYTRYDTGYPKGVQRTPTTPAPLHRAPVRPSALRNAADPVVVVVEENHSIGQLIGSPPAPFLNRLAAKGTPLTRWGGPGSPGRRKGSTCRARARTPTEPAPTPRSTTRSCTSPAS